MLTNRKRPAEALRPGPNTAFLLVKLVKLLNLLKLVKLVKVVKLMTPHEPTSEAGGGTAAWAYYCLPSSETCKSGKTIETSESGTLYY